MSLVCEKDQCTGCMACTDMCPVNAIEVVDATKVFNAVIDDKKCINCGLCHKNCPSLHPASLKKPACWYQGWANDNDLRGLASSGGFAGAIEKAFVEKGGIVYSCVFRDGQFNFESADTVNDLQKFAGSKYVKSNPSGTYKMIKKDLAIGKKVLFTGLPCQVSGLRNVVGEKLSDNLYTIDLICHGTPSVHILNTFLEQHNVAMNELAVLKFRTKGKFGMAYGMAYDPENIRFIAKRGVLDKYLMAFLCSLMYTDNCYECKYAKLERVSDLTIGDSWGTELTEEMKQGVSLALSQTDKGEELLKMADISLQDVDLDNAVANNHQLQSPSKIPARREEFFERFDKGEKFDSIVKSIYREKSIKQDIKGLLISMKLIKA